MGGYDCMDGMDSMGSNGSMYGVEGKDVYGGLDFMDGYGDTDGVAWTAWTE